MRMCRLAAPAVAVLLLLFFGLACSSSSVFAQGEDASSSDIVPPMPRTRASGAINVNSTSPRGAVKAFSDCGDNANGTLTVVGTGHSSGAPDVARIRMTVEATEPNAADARSKAAETTQAVMDAIEQFPDAETRSTSVSVYAQRDTQQGVTKTTGFQFRQSLVVTLVSPGSDNSQSGGGKKRNKDNGSTNTTAASDTLASLASRALDAAILAGGDRISIDNLEFQLNPEKEAAAVVEARARALVDIRDKAERDAANLGLTLGALISVKVEPYAHSGGGAMRGSLSMAASPEAPHKAGPSTPLSSPDAETEVTAEGVYRVCSPSS